MIICELVIGCTFNPNAKNLDAQVNRLERKVAAGAQFAMTQPVFDVERLEEMTQRTAHLAIPIFTGIWPLLSGRQAEFLHNEVPGIVVADSVRAEMAGREEAEGRARGIEFAKEISLRRSVALQAFICYAVPAIPDPRRTRSICATRLKR